MSFESTSSRRKTLAITKYQYLSLSLSLSLSVTITKTIISILPTLYLSRNITIVDTTFYSLSLSLSHSLPHNITQKDYLFEFSTFVTNTIFSSVIVRALSLSLYLCSIYRCCLSVPTYTSNHALYQCLFIRLLYLYIFSFSQSTYILFLQLHLLYFYSSLCNSSFSWSMYLFLYFSVNNHLNIIAITLYVPLLVSLYVIFYVSLSLCYIGIFILFPNTTHFSYSLCSSIGISLCYFLYLTLSMLYWYLYIIP